MDFDEFKEQWQSGEENIACRTSGSTGNPSTILLPRQRMIESAARSCTFFNITNESLLYSCVGADYIGGKMMLVRSEVSGAAFNWEIPSNRPLCSYEGPDIDLLSVVPSQMIHLLNHPELIAKVKRFLIGGAAIPLQIRERIIEAGIEAYESYGMTETSSHVALREIKPDNPWFTALPGIEVFHHSYNLLGIRIEDWKEFLTNDIAEIKD
ncbi:MAG: AMP-binding protein, partial [Muribaculaceae bacterium]|nr:AMP-binding protein [Muribaculaceae bacterium]